jgi:uncharacterized protein with PhoU and TrkA domain
VVIELWTPFDAVYMTVAVGAGASGQSLVTVKLHERAGVIVFERREGSTQRHFFNPPAERPLAAGDVVIACADAAQLETARRIAREG